MQTDLIIQTILAETKEKVENIHKFDPTTYPLWDTLTEQQKTTIIERENKREMKELEQIQKERMERIKKRLEEFQIN